MNCVNCQQPFEPNKKGRKRIRCYRCSPDQTGVNAHGKRPTPIICKHCGTATVVPYALLKYCSDVCKIASTKHRMRKVQIARRRTTDTGPRLCKYANCNNTITLAFKPGMRFYYCSEECAIKEKYRLSGGNCHKVRAKRFGCEYENIDKVAVFIRDNWTCQHCKCKTPRELMGTTADDAPQLDHWVPMSAGGGHTWDNVRCCCRRCNVLKGAKVPPTLEKNHAQAH